MYISFGIGLLSVIALYKIYFRSNINFLSNYIMIKMLMIYSKYIKPIRRIYYYKIKPIVLDYISVNGERVPFYRQVKFKTTDVVDVRWRYNEKYYKITLYGSNIKYPIYKMKELRGIVDIESILSATIIDSNNNCRDITDIMQEYIGPKQNFYRDFYRYGMRVYHLRDNNGRIICQDSERMEILMNDLREYKFEHNSVILLE